MQQTSIPNFKLPFANSPSAEDFAEVRRLRKYACVRLYVEYADPFVANRRCSANFGFYAQPKGLVFLDKYNGVGYEDKKPSSMKRRPGFKLTSLPKRRADFTELMDCAPVTKLADGLAVDLRD